MLFGVLWQAAYDSDHGQDHNGNAGANGNLHESEPELDSSEDSRVSSEESSLAEPEGDWKSLIRPVLHIDGMASLTQLLVLFLEKQEVASLVDKQDGQIVGWITMDDVMKVLMGART